MFYEQFTDLSLLLYFLRKTHISTGIRGLVTRRLPTRRRQLSHTRS